MTLHMSLVVDLVAHGILANRMSKLQVLLRLQNASKLPATTIKSGVYYPYHQDLKATAP